ncbi:hypothetical protein ACKKBG_A24270 [Auxenochlorella protothecoides x Auxenochlorella symbiontica]
MVNCGVITRSMLLVAALLLALTSLQAAAASNFPAKCSACAWVAEVLRKRMDAEVPRNHLDLRHRLDAQGNRYGKVIDYKISELRSIELLDDLCDDLKKDYDYNSTSGAWESTSGKPASGDGLDRKENQRLLDNYCGMLMEEHEDALSAALRSGKLTASNAADVLCRQTAAVCSEEGLQAHAAVGTGGPSVPVSSASEVLNAELESAAKPEL